MQNHIHANFQIAHLHTKTLISCTIAHTYHFNPNLVCATNNIIKHSRKFPSTNGGHLVPMNIPPRKEEGGILNIPP
jgi:hypothetical protein